MAWCVGVGKYPKEWPLAKSNTIKRAKGKCELCGKKPDRKNPHYWDSLKTYNFHVHHKDGNKSNCLQDNLIYVCCWCHGKLHKTLNGLEE